MRFNELSAPGVLRDVFLEPIHFMFLSRDLILSGVQATVCGAVGGGPIAISEIHSLRPVPRVLRVLGAHVFRAGASHSTVAGLLLHLEAARDLALDLVVASRTVPDTVLLLGASLDLIDRFLQQSALLEGINVVLRDALGVLQLVKLLLVLGLC